MLEKILDFVFPAQCAVCECAGSGFCHECEPRGSVLRFRTQTLNVTAVAPYEGNLRKAILAFKDGRRDVGVALGHLLRRRIEMPAIVVPVPTTGRRAAQRGFDGSELLAQQTGCTVWKVLKQVAGDSQRGRSRSERLVARRRFACGPLPQDRIEVVLLDDVATTGTTLEDCAATLRERGAIVKEALVLAQAKG